MTVDIDLRKPTDIRFICPTCGMGRSVSPDGARAWVGATGLPVCVKHRAAMTPHERDPLVGWQAIDIRDGWDLDRYLASRGRHVRP